MIDLIARAAAADPAHPAVVTPEHTLTYGELLDGARRVAGGLRSREVAGFAVVEHDAGWVLRLLAGAALVGAEPCQYQPDVSAGEFAEHARALGHAVVVTRRTDLGGVRLLDPAELLAADPLGEMPAPDAPQPLTIRTTGTTGRPKAARHDWRVLGRTVAEVRPRPEQRWLLAYGPQQFAGIQVLQHVAASAATLVAPFPRQPSDGLRALVADRVGCVSATPTYWRFLLAEARGRDVALPELTQITLGGEASPGDLLADLREAFPAARISHVYASTELGSVVSVTDGRPGFPVTALCGEDNPSSHLKVIDGELWVRARAGMLGYAGQGAEATTDHWRPTGDLVEIVEDRVLFRGRDSEVINVGGVKVHPLPIEERINALPGVAMARVFGRPNRLTGAIVATEVVPDGGVSGADTEGIRAEIRAAVADLPRAAQPRSIAFVDTLETLGAKTVRRMEP